LTLARNNVLSVGYVARKIHARSRINFALENAGLKGEGIPAAE